MSVFVRCCLAALVLWAIEAQGATVQEFSRTLPLAPGGQVSVQSDRAIVRITAWDRAEVAVAGRIEARPGSSDPEASVRRAHIDVEPTSGGVRVVLRYDHNESSSGWDGNNMRPLVRLEVQVPRQVALKLLDSRSEVDVAGLTGSVALELDRSVVRLAGLTGSLKLEADRGEVAIRQLALTSVSRIDVDRTRIDLALTRGATLQVDMDRGDVSVDPSLAPTSTVRHERRLTTFQGLLAGGGPTLRVTGDRGSLRLRRE